MSGSSRSTSDQGTAGQALAALAADPNIAAPFRAAIAAPVTPASADGRQTAGKPARTYCPGPAGLWPCALELSHPGDHEPRVPSAKVAAKVAEAMRRTDAGLCGYCGGEIDDDGGCADWCGGEA